MAEFRLIKEARKAMLERAQSRTDTDKPARKNLHFYAILIMHNNEFHVDISIHVYNVF